MLARLQLRQELALVRAILLLVACIGAKMGNSAKNDEHFDCDFCSIDKVSLTGDL